MTTSQLAAGRSHSMASMSHWRQVLLVLGAGIGIMLGCGPILFYSFGVMVRPIAEATGWDRTVIASAGGMAAIVFGLMSPVIGALLDRIQPRRMACLGIPALALGLILLGLLPHSAGGFVAVMVLAALLGTLQLPHASNYVIVGHFEQRRGLALGIALSFAGLGIALTAPYSAYLVQAFGWRTAYVLMGVTLFVIGMPSAWFLLKDPLPRAGCSADPAMPEVAGMSLSEALRERRFWLLLAAFTLVAATVGASTVHLPVVLGDRGVPAGVAATAVSLIGIATIVSRIVFGMALDRFPPALVTALVFLGPSAGLMLLAMGESAPWAVISAALLVGVGLGVEVDAVSFLGVRAFGMRHFGKIFGMLFLAICLGTGIGPVVVAFAAKHHGYTVALWLAACSGILAAVLVALSGDNKYAPRSA